MEVQPQDHHFLVVSYPAPSHVNPSLELAKRLARLGARVTFSTAVSLNRRLSPPPNQTLLRYSPYSVGEYDDSLAWDSIDHRHFVRQLNAVGRLTLTKLARDLATDGLRVTCVIYNFMVPWAADVAHDLGVPSVLHWIQPATVFGAYYHYFHGYASHIDAHRGEPFYTVDLPGLSVLRVRDLPSLVLQGTHLDKIFFPVVEELFCSLDRQISEVKAPTLKVLINIFDGLESGNLQTTNLIELIPVGPALPSAYTDCVDEGDSAFNCDLFDQESTQRWVGWLEAQPDRSVVYVSFGSYAVLPVRQREEISRALESSGRPYLWVARGDREGLPEDGGRAMVVEWVSQLEVLSHRAVGCFVTHCGWNSTIESLVCGVPTVGLPQWSDQLTISRLTEAVWGTGVRAEAGADGLVEAAELLRCLDLVMGDGEDGEKIRQKTAAWKEQAKAAMTKGGSSDRNLRAFVQGIHTD